MRLAGTPLLACALLSVGCSYHNVIYNAGRLFEAGEEHRQAGRDSLALVHYRDVARKTGQAYRARPQSDWACDALVLLGRAHLRLGDLRAARATFQEATGGSGRCSESGDVGVYIAAISAEMGDRAGALERLNRALAATLSDEAAAEAHLLRGELLLQRGLVEHGWWDLDRATQIDRGVRTAASLAALRWSVTGGDRERARRALERLFTFPEAGVRADSIVRLSTAARDRWSPGGAASILDGVDEAAWDRPARARVALHRAELLHEAGDSVAARAQASVVASGLGSTAAEARLLLSDWRLERASDLQEVYEVRPILLPSGSDPRVATRLAAIAELEAFVQAGLDEPLGWFAAAEVARDRLGASYVARGLLLAYADAAPGDPWTAKALLAAIEITPAVGDRAWLRGRLEAHGSSPYVLAALGGPAAGFEALEQELEVRLRELPRR